MGFGKLVAIALFSLLILGYCFAAPGIPHQFYGGVTINGALADGATVVAEIDGKEVIRTVSSNGTYGYDPYIFYVPDPNGTYASTNTLVTFLLNGKPVNESAVTFENNGYTNLNLSWGVTPYCGDGSCSAGEDCSSCETDCGTCGGGTPIGSTGPGNTGGGAPKLKMEIEGECVGQEIEVTVLNTVGNPAANATVKVLKDRKTIAEEKTGDDGIVSFTFEDTGEYAFYATKNLYSQNSKTITLSECEEGETLETGEEIETGLCENVDCDDQNPCTTEFCVNSTGHCLFEKQPDNTACSGEGKCQKGVCVELQPEASLPAGPTGLVGLSVGQGAGAGLVIAALIGLFAFLYARSKRKKKK